MKVLGLVSLQFLRGGNLENRMMKLKKRPSKSFKIFQSRRKARVKERPKTTVDGYVETTNFGRE